MQNNLPSYSENKKNIRLYKHRPPEIAWKGMSHVLYTANPHPLYLESSNHQSQSYLGNNIIQTANLQPRDVRVARGHSQPVKYRDIPLTKSWLTFKIGNQKRMGLTKKHFFDWVLKTIPYVYTNCKPNNQSFNPFTAEDGALFLIENCCLWAISSSSTEVGDRRSKLVLNKKQGSLHYQYYQLKQGTVEGKSLKTTIPKDRNMS